LTELARRSKTRSEDAVAYEVAVAFLDHVAEVNADPKVDTTLLRQTGVALDHRILHFDGATHRVDDAATFCGREVEEGRHLCHATIAPINYPTDRRRRDALGLMTFTGLRRPAGTGHGSSLRRVAHGDFAPDGDSRAI
jgi:hypothetical protein